MPDKTPARKRRIAAPATATNAGVPSPEPADPLQHLPSLLKLDRRLRATYKLAGDFPPRSREPGFGGLARIVVGQQVSVASANAIWARLAALPRATTAEGFLALDEAGLAGVGLSRNKFATLRGVASAITSGTLDLNTVSRMPAETAIDELTKCKGIGPWSAEIYLMFCAGHPDIFPAGDLALQKAVGRAFGIDPLSTRPALAQIASAWAPYRSTAALLFWHFYAVVNQRQGQPI